MTGLDIAMGLVVLMLVGVACVAVLAFLRREVTCDAPDCDEPGIWSYKDGGPGALCMRHVEEDYRR